MMILSLLAGYVRFQTILSDLALSKVTMMMHRQLLHKMRESSARVANTFDM
jgi:hypothetical protein